MVPSRCGAGECAGADQPGLDVRQTDEGVPQDDAEAVRWYRLAAEQGHADAQSNLGVMYDTGRGVPQDDAEAVRWYRLAAEQGHAIAQRRLDEMLKSRADADGDYQKGLNAYNKRDYATALRELKPLAEQGDAARRQPGLDVRNGRGVPQDDAEAVRWYRLAAEQGHAWAQNNLGWMYDTGRGVPQDDAEAVRWYRLAAEQGTCVAQPRLDAMLKSQAPNVRLATFQKGLDAYNKGDYATALREWKPLAEQGDAGARPTGCGCTATDEVSPQDDAEAVRWFRLAAEQGHARAQADLGGMRTSPDVVSPRTTPRLPGGSVSRRNRGMRTRSSTLGCDAEAAGSRDPLAISKRAWTHTTRATMQTALREWYPLAAEQGLATAPSPNLGLMYDDRTKVSPRTTLRQSGGTVSLRNRGSAARAVQPGLNEMLTSQAAESTGDFQKGLDRLQQGRLC